MQTLVTNQIHQVARSGTNSELVTSRIFQELQGVTNNRPVLSFFY